MSSIFISYRRGDSAGHAQNLHLRLLSWFDADAVFFDAASIESGEPFPDRIAHAVDAAAVVLVMVAPGWAADLVGRAGLSDVDYSREEVRRALVRRAGGAEMRIIPVLLGRASLPSAAERAEGLRRGGEPCRAMLRTLVAAQPDRQLPQRW